MTKLVEEISMVDDPECQADLDKYKADMKRYKLCINLCSGIFVLLAGFGLVMSLIPWD